MSATANATELEVRYLIGDTNYGDPVVAQDDLRSAMHKTMHLLAAQYGLGQGWTTATMPSSGNRDGTLGASTTQSAQIIAVQRRSDHWPLERLSEEGISDLYAGGSVYPSGPPQGIWFWEDSTQVVNFRVWPASNGSESTLDILVSTLPGSLALDTATIPFSDDMLAVLALETAATVLSGLDDANLTRLAKDRGLATSYHAQAMALGSGAQARRNAQKRGHGVRMVEA